MYYRVVEVPIHRHEENATQQFIEKYRDQITGVLSGFDRLVIRGSLRRLNFGYFDDNLKAFVAKGMEEYLWQNKILFKHYAEQKGVSERLKNESLKSFEKQQLPKIFLRSPSVDKDALARKGLRSERSRADWCVRSARWSRAGTGILACVWSFYIFL